MCLFFPSPASEEAPDVEDYSASTAHLSVTTSTNVKTDSSSQEMTDATPDATQTASDGNVLSSTDKGEISDMKKSRPLFS